jgi:glycerol-3-phosphate cytidylyltransferase
MGDWFLCLEEESVPRVVLTYGTFDLFHIGHLNILRRLRALGDELIVGVSTDDFNRQKGKNTVISYRDRAEIVGALSCVDKVIPERDWGQKVNDIHAHGVSVFGMGDDWAGKFDELKTHCEVVYLPRTSDISTSEVKQLLKMLDQSHVEDLKRAIDLIASIVRTFDQ